MRWYSSYCFFVNIMTKKEYLLNLYLRDRERHGNLQGYFRCSQELKQDEKCLKQCRECNEYYEKRLKEK